MPRKVIAVTAVTCVALLLAVSGASAQTVTQRAYSAPGGSVQQQLHGADAAKDGRSRVARAGSGGLPFTGLDLGLVALAGGVLVAMGFGMRRISRPAAA